MSPSRRRLIDGMGEFLQEESKALPPERECAKEPLCIKERACVKNGVITRQAVVLSGKKPDQKQRKTKKKKPVELQAGENSRSVELQRRMSPEGHRSANLGGDSNGWTAADTKAVEVHHQQELISTLVQGIDGSNVLRPDSEASSLLLHFHNDLVPGAEDRPILQQRSGKPNNSGQATSQMQSPKTAAKSMERLTSPTTPATVHRGKEPLPQNSGHRICVNEPLCIKQLVKRRAWPIQDAKPFRQPRPDTPNTPPNDQAQGDRSPRPPRHPRNPNNVTHYVNYDNCTESVVDVNSNQH